MMTKDLISTSEAAKLKGVHRDTVRRWINNGWITAEKSAPSVPKSPWLLSRDEVLAFVPPRPGWREGVARCSRCGEVLTADHECRPEQVERWAEATQKRLQAVRERGLSRPSHAGTLDRNAQDEESTQ